MLLLLILLGYLGSTWADIEPVIEMIPSNGRLHVLKGREASLMCNITQGKPTPTVTWVKGPEDLPAGEGEELKFDPVKREDDGGYRCTAINTAASKTGSFSISVYDVEKVASFTKEEVRLKNKRGSDGLKLTWYNTEVAPGDERENKSVVAEWLVNTQESSNVKPGYKVDEKTGDLLIPNLTLNHEGFYTAFIMDPFVENTYSYTDLTVFVAPTGISIEIGDNIAGTEENITCGCSSVKPGNVTFEWTFKDIILPDDLVTSASKNEDGTYKVTSTVMKTFSREDNGGLLKCTVIHGIDASKAASTEMELNVLYVPSGRPVVLPATGVKVESEFSLTCDASGLDKGNPPGDEYEWLQDGIKDQGQNGESYRFTPKLVADSGRYSCFLKNKAGKSSEGYTYVTVEAPPFIEMAKDGQLHGPLYNDRDFVVSYLISGTRLTDIKLKNSSLVVTKENFAISISAVSGSFKYGQDSALKVTWHWVLEKRPLESCANVTFFDGDYMVEAEGYAGKTSSTSKSSFHIGVQYPPMWGTATKRDSAALNDQKILHCDVCANPEPWHYSWSFMGNDLESIRKEYSIKHVTSKDFGLYTCMVTNTINDIDFKHAFNITLEEKGPPHDPEDFQVSSRTAKTLLVTWGSPFDGGYSLEKYELVVNDGEPIQILPNLQSWRIEKLEPQHTYHLKIRAKNTREDSSRSYSSYVDIRERTSAIPNFEPLEPFITSGALIIKWLYISENSQKESKEGIDNNVTVVIRYSMGNDDFTRHPQSGGIPASRQHSEIKGTFDVDATYVIKYEVYEGEEQSVTTPEVTIGPPQSMTPGILAGFVIGGLVLVALISIIVIKVIRCKRNHKESKPSLGDQSYDGPQSDKVESKTDFGQKPSEAAYEVLHSSNGGPNASPSNPTYEEIHEVPDQSGYLEFTPSSSVSAERNANSSLPVYVNTKDSSPLKTMAPDGHQLSESSRYQELLFKNN